MEKKTSGAWIVHHTKKLRQVVSQGEFEQIETAGKCGLLLSSLSQTDQATVPKDKIDALAKAAGINTRTELPALIEELASHHLISTSKTTKDIEILGLTGSSVLQHVTDIFESFSPQAEEKAALYLAELASNRPLKDTSAIEQISDTFKITKTKSKELIESSEEIGFIDSEELDDKNKLFFNGNLFRKENAKKVSAVLSSLSTTDAGKITTITEMLKKNGCLELQLVQKELGTTLFQKCQAIAMFDVNEVSNSDESVKYVTLPSAFNKFVDPIVDDAFDLAKALVASLTYGITKSSSGRGKIQMIGVLLGKLVKGYWIGPATAIGQDYKVLEIKGVVQVRHEKGSMYSMKLLKREIGEIALQVLISGDGSTAALEEMPQISLSDYIGPEENRAVLRKKTKKASPRAVSAILDTLRTGG